MAAPSVDMNVNGSIEASCTTLQPPNHDDDDFDDLVDDDDTPGENGDTVNCTAVNYKVSFDEYQKVDVFQTTEVLKEKPQQTIIDSSPQVEEIENDETEPSPAVSESLVTPDSSLTLDTSMAPAISPTPVGTEVSEAPAISLTPDDNSVTPGDSASTLNSSGVIPYSSGVTPKSSGVTPDSSGVTPDNIEGVADDSAVTLGNSGVPSNDSSVTPEKSAVTPDNGAAAPDGPVLTSKSVPHLQLSEVQRCDEVDGAERTASLPNNSMQETSGGLGDSDNLSEVILKAEVSRTAEPAPSEQLLRAQAEWDAVETIQPGKHSVVRTAPLISFNEALGFFQTRNMDSYLSKIKPCIHRSGFSALRHLILGPPKMNRTLQDERDLVFAIAQYSFDDNEAIHKRVLQTIYRQLTGSAIDCPRFGSHWEQIGFQGTDPATDLRACGFLGLLTLLDFLMDSQKLALAKDIYRLSLHETQNFPFCVMSINMTRIALQTLREELLSRECNRRKQVFGVLNDFYASLFLQLYQTWKHQRKTIHDSGFVLKDLEATCKKNPKSFMKDLEVHLAERSTRGGDITPRSGVNSSPRKEKYDMDFAGVHELDDKKG